MKALKYFFKLSKVSNLPMGKKYGHPVRVPLQASGRIEKVV
jgi:hypothetical protein